MPVLFIQNRRLSPQFSRLSPHFREDVALVPIIALSVRAFFGDLIKERRGITRRKARRVRMRAKTIIQQPRASKGRRAWGAPTFRGVPSKTTLFRAYGPFLSCTAKSKARAGEWVRVACRRIGA